MYDENGEPFGFSFGGNDYYYVRNAQNDIYLILDSNNQAVVLYQYDAWGNITHCYDISTNDIVSTLNPYTYRGYFRDNETGFYYLKSRYYFPEFHRFICADYLLDIRTIDSINLFSYCTNNPVNYIDVNGSLWLAIAAVVVIVAVLISIPSDNNQAPIKEKSATEKYNKDSVNVFSEESGGAKDDGCLINAKVYTNNKGNKNINISNSRNVHNSYEMNAVLKVIMESEYYSVEEFGSISFMRAQWVAHNMCYDIASNSNLGYWAVQKVFEFPDPIASSDELDLRSLDNIRTAPKILYTIVSIIY